MAVVGAAPRAEAFSEGVCGAAVLRFCWPARPTVRRRSATALLECERRAASSRRTALPLLAHARPRSAVRRQRRCRRSAETFRTIPSFSKEAVVFTQITALAAEVRRQQQRLVGVGVEWATAREWGEEAWRAAAGASRGVAPWKGAQFHHRLRRGLRACRVTMVATAPRLLRRLYDGPTGVARCRVALL